MSALTAAQPADLGPSEIEARLGAPWIPHEDIEAFIVETLNPRYIRFRVRYAPPVATWSITELSALRQLPAANEQWGTARVDAIDLIVDALNLRSPTIRITNADGTSSIDQEATLAAREKQQDLKDHFKTWIWADEARAARLVDTYNFEVNNLVAPRFRGDHLTLPGAAVGVDLRPHQKDGVWRIVSSGNTLLAHDVGTGKSFIMIAAAMESKRLGLATKPMIAVPNHLIEQFGAEFLRLYPTAKVLIAGKKDFEAGKRQQFLSRMATGTWDAVVIGHSSFSRIPISDDTYVAFMESQIAQLVDYIVELAHEEGRRSPSIKELEKAKKRLEAKMAERAKRETKDTTLVFEELGVDMLMVDEADLFKNLWFPTKMTRVAGLPSSESDRAFDMFLKTRHVQQITNGRGIVFATGTPIANSMAEMYTMQRYLQLPLLEANGLEHFDAWAASFGETVQALELAPEGTGYRVRTRFAKFSNLPELLTMFRSVADIQKAKDLKSLADKIPKQRGGQAEAVAVEATADLKAYMATLVARANRIRTGGVDPRDDNMLKVTGDGGKAALDMRLLGPQFDADPTGKLATAADAIASWHAGSREARSPLSTTQRRTRSGRRSSGT